MLKHLRPLFPYLRKYRGTLLLGSICVLLTNGIAVLFPQVILRATDALNAMDRRDPEAIRHQLLIYALLLLAVALSKGIFQFLTRWLVIGVSRDIEYDLRNDLFRHLESLSLSYYQKNRTGDIMARATNDLNAVRMLLGPAIMYSANTLVFTIAALIFMWRTSPKLTMYAFVPLPLASVMVNPAIDPCVQATVTGAFPVTPVVLMDRGMASPDVTCTIEEVNSVITGGATTVDCFLEINGNGGTKGVTVGDDGDPIQGASSSTTDLLRTTLSAGDVVVRKRFVGDGLSRGWQFLRRGGSRAQPPSSGKE